MFRPSSKHLLIICLVLLDIPLALNIYKESSPKVLAAHTVRISRIPKAIPTKKPTVTPTSKPAPTKPKPTVTPLPSPTKIPVKYPSQTPTPSQASAQNPTPQSSSQNQTPSNYSISALLAQVNSFRASKGLYAVKTDGYTCALATTRATEIATGFSHDGFNNRVSSHSLPYPTYSYVNENIAMNSDPGNVVQAWIDSPGHNENMQKDTPNVCIARNGNFYAYEGWKP